MLNLILSLLTGTLFIVVFLVLIFFIAKYGLLLINKTEAYLKDIDSNDKM